ncbi:MAG TPA: protein-methionine-sulfoxide reductase heme-binding subunit MsrQ [Micropepsaceae bacterium]|nr:protein-methionine-sulfoxide reductase heme-binding subunit MsrQ [Micropepsaceae bacterium]
MITSNVALWRDRRGRFSPVRAATLALLIAPAVALVWFSIQHDLGPRPRTEAIHEVGLWSVRFLLLTLFVTPIRRIARYAPLVDVRRMLGVGCYAYIALHLVLYIADQTFNIGTVVSEIVLRYYLTIGFTAWVGLAVLAATSNDYMVRRLGGLRWRKLHRLVFPVAVLGSVHYFMQSKLEVFEPTVVGGIFIWLMLYRVLHWRYPRNTEFPMWVIAASWFVVGGLVFIGEAVGFWIAFHAPILRVLVLDFNFEAGIRPGWYVWGIGVLVTAIGLWRTKPRETWLPFLSGRPSGAG